jgi:hypothetical protein
MAEYIEREAFLKDIEERYCLPCKEAGKDHNGFICHACWADAMRVDVIDAPAADVAPVVHCRHCRSYNKPRLGWCSVHMDREGPDDFCSYGVRMEGDSDELD